MLSEQALETIKSTLAYYRKRTLHFRERNPELADKDIALVDAALAELDALTIAPITEQDERNALATLRAENDSLRAELARERMRVIRIADSVIDLGDEEE